MYEFAEQMPQSTGTQDIAGSFIPAVVEPVRKEACASNRWAPGSPAEKAAWVHFVSGGSVNPQRVRKPILDSWRRSRDAGVDFTGGNSSTFLSQAELATRRDAVLSAITPAMETLYQCVRGTNFLVNYLDADGYILAAMGDISALRQSEGIQFTPGANWSELLNGTNGPGTALALGTPIQVTGPEHYREDCQGWTCAAVPVRDGEDRIVGCLNLSGPRSEAHPYLLGMVMSGARAIQSCRHMEQTNSELDQTNRRLHAVLDTVAEGVIAVDRKGTITHANRAAARILRRSEARLIGQSADDFFSFHAPIGDLLRDQNPCIEEDVTLVTAAGTLSCIAALKPLTTAQEEAEGGIITVRQTRKPAVSAAAGTGCSARFTFRDIVGSCPEIREVVLKAKMVSRSPSTVLLQGESGTGKELFAQSIHNASNRCQGPFVAVNCGAIPQNLIQSELFGYVEGAFTDAKKGGRLGKFELAHGGTIFLDEIADMCLEMQVNLLRVLEERVLTRVGGATAIPVDVRVIAATHRDLNREVEQGRFRNDLYYRLNVIVLKIPPLRDRRDDIRSLIDHQVLQLAEKLGKTISGVEPEAMECLFRYPWPGNVRELMNVIEQGVNLVQRERLRLIHLPENLRSATYPEPAATPMPVENGAAIQPLQVMEKAAIQSALSQYLGNISKVAKTLGIGRTTLYEKMKRHGIERCT